jgi:hypothetical protein
MENVGIFSIHLYYFKAIGHILLLFGNFGVIRYIFHCVGVLYDDKSGNPGGIRSRKKRS